MHGIRHVLGVEMEGARHRLARTPRLPGGQTAHEEGILDVHDIGPGHGLANGAHVSAGEREALLLDDAREHRDAHDAKRVVEGAVAVVRGNANLVTRRTELLDKALCGDAHAV